MIQSTKNDARQGASMTRPSEGALRAARVVVLTHFRMYGNVQPDIDEAATIIDYETIIPLQAKLNTIREQKDTAIDELIEERRKLRAKLDMAVEAIESAKFCMGDDYPSDDWHAPEDVWDILDTDITKIKEMP